MLEKNTHISLRIAFIATVFTAVVFLFLFLFIGLNQRKYAYEDSKLLAKEISRKAAVETEVYLSSALMVARSFEQKVQIIRKYRGTRNDVIEMLLTSLSRNPNFLGAWTMWEPNAFDGKDYKYRNDSHYNSQGSLGIGFFRFDNKIFTEIMTPADYLGPHYVVPRDSAKNIIIDPYRFVYTGYKQVFYGTTVSAPIFDNGKFLGVIGIDIDLNNLQKKFNKVRPYGTGFLSIITNKGTIVTHIDSSLINKNIFKLFSTSDTLSKYSIVKGRELTIETISEFTGEKVFRFFYPISINKEILPWSMMVEIPIEEATTRSKQLFNIAIGTLFVGLSLLIYLIFNILDRRRYERQLLSAKLKAEESDRLKTAFLHNISHEIRTPLNGILGFLELITSTKVATDEQIRTYKEIIRSSSKQLLSVISNVIELSKIQTNQVETFITSFDVERVISKVISDFHLEISEKGLNFVSTFPTNNLRTFINSDEYKFKQIFSNLISNAIKFTHFGSIEVGYNIQGNSILFFVKDTGVGIKPENNSGIFKIFSQEDQTLSRNFGGLGIGLSITKSYVELLGGSIRFESEPDKGTTFYVKLPYQEEASEPV